MSVTINQ